MCTIYDEDDIITFSVVPNTINKPREITMTVYNCYVTFGINDAIDNGFDFSLLPNPTSEEIAISQKRHY